MVILVFATGNVLLITLLVDLNSGSQPESLRDLSQGVVFYSPDHFIQTHAFRPGL